MTKSRLDNKALQVDNNSIGMKINIELRTKLNNIPDSAGVYLFKNAEGKVIYVGKAKSLKNRVKSYFGQTHDHPRIARLVQTIADLEVLTTDNELEALILESNLIKEYQPRYNVNLKDDKRFPYIKITNEAYPRVLVVRRITDDKAKYYGPYTNVKSMRSTLKMIRKIFPVRSCNLIIPSAKKYRVCLDFHIGRCPGCCEPDRTNPAEYAEIISGVALFLSGKTEEVADLLKAKMAALSDNLEFEKAAQVRDQLRAIDSIIQRQKVDQADFGSRDVIALDRSGDDICIVVLQIRQGVMIGRQHFYLTAAADIPVEEIIRSFLLRYYAASAYIPEQIYLPALPDDPELIAAWFEKKTDNPPQILNPRKGEKHRLIELAEKNARLLLGELIAQKSTTRKRPQAALLSLQRDLYLKNVPFDIAACDVSNLGGTDAVGSIVFFANGKPLKKKYRRFKIKTVEGQDDFSMMGEVVARYFNKLAETGEDFPDLLLVDGGKGQLKAALEALRDLGLESQPCAAIAKRFEEVYLPGRGTPIGIPRTSSALKLLQLIRDEAHRFALTYHRNLRSRRVELSELDAISGIGEKRKIALLKSFGSLEKIKAARLQDLLAARVVPSALAIEIYNHFHQSG